jgi:hypothetical protein
MTQRPLFCVRFYEPQELSLAEGKHVPDVLEPDEIVIESLQSLDGLPKRNLCTVASTLPQLAKLAFPETKEEKARAAKRPVAAKPAAKTPAAKKQPIAIANRAG